MHMLFVIITLLIFNYKRLIYSDLYYLYDQYWLFYWSSQRLIKKKIKLQHMLDIMSMNILG